MNPMASGEPMAMGSPASPMAMGSPMTPGSSGLNQSTFLPAYLMGDPTPMMQSSPNRLWSNPSSSSPPKGSISKSSASFIATPGKDSVFSPATKQPSRDTVGRGKEKSGAPPVQGLLEHITSPVQSLERSRLDSSVSSRLGYSMNVYSTPGFQNTSIMESHKSFVGTPKKTPPSPAQRDPFYTQGESLRADDELDDTWITVFGFPAGATSFILQQFSQYGNILKHVVSTEGNWLHIQYQSKLQAKKALSKNGKVFGNSIMVGVSSCIDKNVMEKRYAASDSIMATPTQASVQNIGCDSMNSSVRGGGTPIRPLTAHYKAASNEHDVLNRTHTPQKNNGFITKAMEYVFGW